MTQYCRNAQSGKSKNLQFFRTPDKFRSDFAVFQYSFVHSKNFESIYTEADRNIFHPNATVSGQIACLRNRAISVRRIRRYARTMITLRIIRYL